MCVNICCGPHDGVLGGFEDGSVVLWDCRNYSEEVTSLKLFTEPGQSPPPPPPPPPASLL